MKRFILVLTACLSLVSCTLEQAQTSNRTSEYLKSETSILKYLAADQPAIVMDNCLKGQEFLNATEKERASSKYAFFGWYSTSKSIKIDNWGEIFPNDSDLQTIGSVWSVKVNDCTYAVECVEENEWKVSCGYDSLTFASTFTFLEKDIDGHSSWECHVEGRYSAKENLYETISTEDDKLIYFWTPSTNHHGFFSMILTSSGNVTSRFFIKDNPTDWCTLTYEKGEITKYTTSIK